MARGALYSTLQGEDLEEVKRIRDLTATSRLAEALGCTEADLAMDWNDYLAPDEINRIKGFG